MWTTFRTVVESSPTDTNEKLRDSNFAMLFSKSNLANVDAKLLNFKFSQLYLWIIFDQLFRLVKTPADKETLLPTY